MPTLPRLASASDEAPGGEAIVAGSATRSPGGVDGPFAIDVTELPEGAVRRGDWATLIGDETGRCGCQRRGTIGYELLTGLGLRYHRIYRAS